MSNWQTLVELRHERVPSQRGSMHTYRFAMMS